MKKALAVGAAPSLQASDRPARMILKGDFRFSVTEQEVAHGSIKGHYTVNAQDMREPLGVLWQAQDGKVRNPGARSTEMVLSELGAQKNIKEQWTLRCCCSH